MKRIGTIFLFFFLGMLFWLPQFSQAQVPTKLSYQAIVRDAQGAPLASKACRVEAYLYDNAECTGNAKVVDVHEEVQSNAQGLITLGIETKELAADQRGQRLWLKVAVTPAGASEPIVTVNELLSVPYALHADNGLSAEERGKLAQAVVQEEDPRFAASPAGSITQEQIAKWDAAQLSGDDETVEIQDGVARVKADKAAEWNGKQDALTAGEGIELASNVVSVSAEKISKWDGKQDALMAGEGIVLGPQGGAANQPVIAVSEELRNTIAGKQDKRDLDGITLVYSEEKLQVNPTLVNKWDNKMDALTQESNAGQGIAIADGRVALDATTLALLEKVNANEAEITALKQQVRVLTEQVYVKVVDVEGNKYKFVDIGDQQWFTTSLRVTKLLDGTAIEIKQTIADENFHTIAKDEFKGIDLDKDKVAWWSKDKRVLLYSWACFDADNICPEGWRLPTKDDAEKLLSTLGTLEPIPGDPRTLWLDTAASKSALLPYDGEPWPDQYNSSGLSLDPKYDRPAGTSESKPGMWISFGANYFLQFPLQSSEPGHVLFVNDASMCSPLRILIGGTETDNSISPVRCMRDNPAK